MLKSAVQLHMLTYPRREFCAIMPNVDAVICGIISFSAKLCMLMLNSAFVCRIPHPNLQIYAEPPHSHPHVLTNPYESLHRHVQTRP